MRYTRAVGFEPVYNKESKALFLGSFPSVKSRAVSFYYGNPQNRFWRTVCSFFEEEAGSTEEKRAFLLRHNLALWDIVTECEIVGSSDSSIRVLSVADIPSLLNKTKISKIYCNGKKSYELLLKYYPQLRERAVCLPSTSPANVRFFKEPWQSALNEIANTSEEQA